MIDPLAPIDPQWRGQPVYIEIETWCPAKGPVKISGTLDPWTAPTLAAMTERIRLELGRDALVLGFYTELRELVPLAEQHLHEKPYTKEPGE